MSTTAAAAYASHQATAVERLQRIRTALDVHQAAAAQKPRDWGFAGDVEAVGQKLLEVLGALDALTPAERVENRI